MPLSLKEWKIDSRSELPKWYAKLTDIILPVYVLMPDLEVHLGPSAKSSTCIVDVDRMGPHCVLAVLQNP
jgi:hypothetical protein